MNKTLSLVLVLGLLASIGLSACTTPAAAPTARRAGRR